MEEKYDVIVVLGGSFIDEKTLPKWAENRIDAAIQRNSSCKHYLLLGRGTPHKPPVIGENGHPINECEIMANYMKERKIDSKKILLDSWSLDTIGNAYATLMMHCLPRNLRKLLIITSDFHMPRTRSIFEKLFSLFPIKIFELKFLETESSLVISDKERKSLENWNKMKDNLNSLVDFHEFIFEKHEIYNSNKYVNKTYDKNDINMKMYCV